MKKLKLLMLLWLIAGYGLTGIAVAQWGNHIQFHVKGINRYNNTEISTVYFIQDNSLSDFLNKRITDTALLSSKPYSPIMLGVKLDKNMQYTWMPDVRSMSKFYRSFNISSNTEAILIAAGITKHNIKNYRYRVVKNDSTELVKWSLIPSLQQKYGATQPYGYIGTFKALNSQLMVEVVNINNYNIREGVIFDWRASLKPVVNQIIIYTPDWHKAYYDPKDQRATFFNINATKINRGMATRFDKQTNVPLDMAFMADSVKSIYLGFKNHAATAYAIYLVKNEGVKRDTTNLSFSFSDDIYIVDSKLFNKPGKYEIIIQRRMFDARSKWPEDKKLKIPFEVKPPPVTEKKVSIKQLIPYTVAALLGVAILFWVYRSQSRAKLHRVAQQKEVAGLKLRSIRAQLNPHFMFNALTSIQNLVNKNNIAEANNYLAKFAALTRHVLDSSNEEMLSLEDELQVLNDYLQMEQLRFNFNYEIKVDELLNQANIEVPAMLLQPFVENAIKHGVAGLNSKGKITIAVMADKNDLVLTITDNGAGFEKSSTNAGYGIKLSQDRMAILNQIYKGQQITLNISAAQPGTTVTTRLTNWI